MPQHGQEVLKVLRKTWKSIIPWQHGKLSSCDPVEQLLIDHAVRLFLQLLFPKSTMNIRDELLKWFAPIPCRSLSLWYSALRLHTLSGTGTMWCLACSMETHSVCCGSIAFTVASSCRNLVLAYTLHCRRTRDPLLLPSSFYYTIISRSPSLYFPPSRSTAIVRCTCMWPERRAIQDSRHVSHSSQNNCRVNEHTARHITSRQALWISSTAAGRLSCRAG